MTTKCQVFFFTVPEKHKSWAELARQGDALRFSIFLSQNINKIEGSPLKSMNIFEKSHNAEKNVFLGLKLVGKVFLSHSTVLYELFYAILLKSFTLIKD